VTFKSAKGIVIVQAFHVVIACRVLSYIKLV